MKKLVALTAVICLLALAAGSATAATKTWNVSSGNWNVSGNWSPSGIPAAGDELKQVYAGGNCLVPTGYSTANMARGYIYNASTPTLQVKGTLNITTSGQFLKVGFGSSGNQPGRLQMNLSTAVINLTNGCDLILGDGGSSRYTGASGYFDFQKGTLNCDEVQLGYRGTSGTIVQSQGQAIANVGVVTIGYDTSLNTCLYDMQDGSLTCTGLNVTRGTLHVSTAAACDINGDMDIAGTGSLNVNVASADCSYLDVSGSAYIHTGSTINITLDGGFTPSSGQEFTIIQSTGGGSIYGTFTNVSAGWTTALRDTNTRLVAIYSPAAQPLVAFPGAYGYGCQATGGRGGSVYKVTNLNNNGSGSFRDAVQSNNTTVIFSTGGTVNLDTRINSAAVNLTVAGQTAPGGGFCVRNGDMWFNNGGNLIVRYMRFRLGRNAGTDSSGNYFDTFTFKNTLGAIADHISTSWSGDECLSVVNQSNNVTVQWCIISEGLNWNGHGYGSLVAPDLANGQMSWHHNLDAHQNGRNPRAASRNNQNFLCDIRNVILYNWGTSGDFGAWAAYYSGEKVDMNWVNNYSIAGPNTTSNASVMLSSNLSTSRIYISGNKIDSNRNGSLDGSTATWSNVAGTKTQMGSEFTIASWAVVPTDSADTAYTNVLAGAGATKPSRDSVDTRVVNSVTNQNGSIINSQDDVGGWPTLAGGSAPTDTDGDGMPDSWESANGTNPNVADNNGDIDGDGYTNLEEYINSL